jgi:folate-dependent phosphoribosylglycinamide formyltransferase PurN
MDVKTLKRFARQCQSGAYFRPANLRVAVDQVVDVERNLRVYSDREHLLAAANWLKRAQDATSDGGLVGRYFLRTGWSSSYPETTGYIIPTLLKLADELHEDEYIQRAQRAIDFLLSVQLDSGAFPGAEIAENRTRPSPFNTGQIMNGLQRWTERTGDERCRTALRRAGHWLCEVQDPSGAFRKYFYQDLVTAYSSHLTCWLAEAGAFLDDQQMLDASSRHLAWVLQHFDAEHAWFDLCGFSEEDHAVRRAVTHTIAYTIWGVLRTAEIVGSAEGKAAAEKAAYAALRRLELSRRLPGVLDYRWRPASSYTCLTGNCQMAIIWLHMYEEHGDPRLLNAALKSIDIVKAAQPMNAADPGVRGGIAGSQPVWGEYISHAFPNWAAKYFIDSLLAKQKALEKEVPFRTKPTSSGQPVPTVLAKASTATSQTKPKVALLTSELATKVMEFHSAWKAWGFRPDLVVIERRVIPPLWVRVRARMSEGRMAQMPNLSAQASAPRPIQSNGNGAAATSVLDFCKQAGIPAVEVDSINSDEAIRVLREYKIDLFVYAGAGILKKKLIDSAPMGVLNAHMGLLPAYRGMNVAEWAAWNRDPVGCTVHLIDAGIDTGDILIAREVDVASARNIGEIRHHVDQNQIALLGEVLQFILNAGALPPGRSQTASEGLQYFTMHPVLVDSLNRRLGSK